MEYNNKILNEIEYTVEKTKKKKKIEIMGIKKLMKKRKEYYNILKCYLDGRINVNQEIDEYGNNNNNDNNNNIIIIAKYLIKHRPDINKPNEGNHCTPLLEAYNKENNEVIINHIIKKGTHINEIDPKVLLFSATANRYRNTVNIQLVLKNKMLIQQIIITESF